MSTILNTTIVKAIITSFGKEAKVIANIRVEQDKAIQKALDAMLTACDKPKAEWLKGNAKSNPARGEVKAIFDALVEAKFIAKATGAMYQSSFWMAFEQGVAFQRDLASKAKPETDSKAAPSPKRTVANDRENLDRILTQAIKMSRDLGLSVFAASILDLCIDTLQDFKEVQ